MNRCEDKAGEYCKQAIRYKKHANIIRCDLCCMGCLEPCGNICNKAVELNAQSAYEGGNRNDIR